MFTVVIMLLLGGFTTRAWALGNSVPTYNGSTWYSLYDATKYDNDNNTTKTRNLNFDVVPPTSGTIYLDWRKNDYWPGADIYVNDTKIAYVNAMSNSHKSFETVNTSLGEDATTVKIGIHGSSKHSAEVESLKVAMKPHIRLDNSDAVGVTSKSGTLANTVYGNTSAAYHIDLRSFLMQNDNLTYTSSNSEFHFGGGLTTKSYAVKANSCAYGSGESGYDCTNSSKVGILGNPDSYEVDVYFTPSANVNAQRNCTITIEDGNVERATVILTAKVIPTYYFKATSVATDGTSSLDIPVKASFTSGVYSGSTLTISQTAATADVASLTKRAYFYAPASSGDYQFQGWYTNAACTSDRVSTDNTIYYDITSSGLTSGTAVEKKYYAKYLESITAEFENEGSHDLEVGDTYESISYSRTSFATATDDDEDEENFFWYEIVDNTPAGITTGSDNADKIISYNPSTKVVTAHNAGTATLRLHQRAHGLYEAVDAEYEFTVSKKTNALKCAWNNGSAGDDWDENMNFDSKLPVKFSSTNTSGPAISVTQSPASAVATFKNGAGGANPDTIITNFREGTVTWTVRQAEDYKYIGDEMTCSVIVGTVPSPGCTIKLYDGDNTERKCSEFGDSRAVWTPAGKAVRLYFEAEKTTGWSRSITPYEYVDGDWKTYDGWAVGGSLEKNKYNTFYRDLNANATAVKFSASNNDDIRVRKVYVTGVSYFNIDTIGGGAITKLNMPVNTKGGNVTRAKFCVDYGTCADNIKLASDHPRIKFAASSSTTHSFSTGANHHGRDTIELTYTSPADEGEDITATITIYTPYDHKTLTVKAKTKVLSTTLEYKGVDSYSVDHANMNATDLFQVRDENGDLVASPAITLSSSNTSKINTVSSNTAIDFLCGADDVRITASYAGDDDYAAASNSGTFYHDIDVIKLTDVISWSDVSGDGKIHVWTDSIIPNTIASGNTTISTYASNNSDRLTATCTAGVWSLNTGVPGEVTLTATSAGDDCTYNGGSASKTIVVEAREHAIIWNQDLEGIQTDDRGYIINRRITLNAYAVDNGSNPTNVPVSYEITGGGTFATIENGNELVINVANLSGTLSTTITATTTVGTKYAIVSETKTISVVRWGTNTAKSADNTSDIKDGKIVIEAPHATFTFSGATAITEFGYATVGGKPEGYKLAQALDNGDGSKTYNFSWVSTNANCSIQVNKISFWIKAYDSDAFIWQKAKVSFDDAAEVSVGTAAMTGNDRDFAHFSKAENYTNRNVPVVCRVTGYENFDFYIKNIAIEYTVYTTAPSATSGIEEVDRTINASDKQTVDVRSLFSYATPAPSDFEYSYEIVGAPEHAFLEGGYLFWADAVGDYTVRAKVNMDEDHRESEWGSEKTIRVNKVPYVFNNSEEDQEWDTKNNWTISSWPIENLPTEDDDVIVRGHLTIDEEIVINSMTIDAGEGYIVEIAPTGGLTVGAGGVIGATKDNLKLKAGTSGVEKGQTGYLRISPDYAGAMPEATVELFSVSYYDQAAGADNSAVWQGVGSPISEAGVLAKSVYTSCWVYSWNEATDGWVNNRATLELTPFVGFSTTQKKEPEGRKYTYEGHLVSGVAPVTMDLAYTEGHGTNLLANSWAAPISIPNFESSDFVNAAQTIYILNAGTKAQSDANEGEFTAPGKYIGVPVLTASELAASGYPVVIPSMQGFWVQAERASAQLRLNYSRLVWGADYSGDGSNQPLRAPKHNAEASPVTGKMKVSISAGGWSDFIFLLESEKYLPEYEDGYDAIKIPSGGMDLFTVEGENYLGVDATNSIIGTRVGVRTSEETAYTMTFSHMKSESDMSLWDLEADQKIEINEGTTYTFFAEPNAEITDRFLIIERAGASTNTTGVDDAEDEANVHKFIKDNQLYILKNGVLYNGTGARVK